MHLLFVSIGSQGDLHPLLAVAQAWVRRGRRATLVALPGHRGRVEAAGLPFYPSGPTSIVTGASHGSPSTEGGVDEVYRRTYDLRRGTRVLYEEVILPALGESYADLRAAIEAERPDGLVGNELALAVPVAADVYGLPWAAAVLQPGSFLSAHDPPATPAAPWLRPLRWAGPRVVRAAYRLLRWTVYAWPVLHLRRALGAPTAGRPLFREKHDADVALALFSPALTPPQPDWPPRTVVCGFPFLNSPPRPEEAGKSELPDDLERFLRAGPPPIVFTLGDTASHVGGDFFGPGLQAARALGARAVVVTGGAPSPSEVHADRQDVFVASYIPYGPLFARARAVVHAGGVGTIALALRAGVPQLIVPHLHDQPDNAARAARTGAALTLRRDRYTVRRVTAALRKLLGRPAYAEAARAIAAVVRAESGADAACDALEAMAYRSAGAVGRSLEPPPAVRRDRADA